MPLPLGEVLKEDQGNNTARTKNVDGSFRQPQF
jgi:hypothetical protein